MLYHLGKIILSLVCALMASLPLGAQTLDYLPPLGQQQQATVSLLTAAPGTEIYELEGHSAIRLQYGNTDIAVSWGVFDFNAPNFVYRFVKGETDYSIGAAPTSLFLWQYAYTGRRVTEQQLNLTSEQSRRVVAAIHSNLRPENRIYRYNYVLDNCATRPLAIIKRAIGAPIELHATPQQLGDNPTFRSEMEHFHAHYPWYQFGIDLALGSGLDRRIELRETMFAPVILEQLAASATIEFDGRSEPLVSRTTILVDGPAEGPILPPTPWFLTPLAIFTLLLIIAIALTAADCRRRRISRWFDTIVFGFYGLTGLVIAFLIFISVHEATSPNWLFLWINPLCLIAAAAIWIHRAQRLMTWFFRLYILAAAIYAAIAIFGVQAINSAFIPMLLTVIVRAANYLVNAPKTTQHKK